MKRLAVCVFALCLLGVVPAFADAILYFNGALDGNTEGFDVTHGVVSNSFNVWSDATMTGFDFASWNEASKVISTVDWAIGTTPFASDVDSGTASVSSAFDFHNGWNWDVDTNAVSGLSVRLDTGITYWLTLTNASTLALWDMNGGPSGAYDQSITSLIASETFDVTGVVPARELGTIGLMGSGMLAMLGLLRRSKIG
jgi:hypothetical protein